MERLGFARHISARTNRDRDVPSLRLVGRVAQGTLYFDIRVTSYHHLRIAPQRLSDNGVIVTLLHISCRRDALQALTSQPWCVAVVDRDQFAH
eukprot:9293202-Pyramimonas_sp.AAC.2